MADTASDLAETKDAIEERQGQRDSTQGEIESLQAEIDELSESIAEQQERHASAARELSLAIRGTYKQGLASSFPLVVVLGADSLDDLVERMQYADAVTGRLTDLTDETQSLADDLQRQYDEISAKKDEQEALLTSLDEEIGRLEEEVDELEEKLEEERLASSAAGSTFATGSTDGWHTGVASAYGGWSDPSTGAVSSTATGAVCDDWSMGVAVPMAWSNYRSYFNRRVEISYNGQSVIAVVNDCGYMGGGSRSLDLQPGVFKAFGFSDCDSWGLRTVSYRFL